MSHQKLLTKLEGFRARNSINHCYINKDVYRLLYDRDFYYIAYNSIKSNDGAETAGSDGTSLHGFCEEWIDDLISSFRDESYQPQPNRITYIPKKNGKMRKLSFPNGKDKLVQECIRIILECIYEPTFSNLSHGFRPNRSVHSALAQVETWRSTVWFIEGDISACFDEIDHRILESILRERIDDERFIRLINKLLKAGYFDMEHNFQTTKRGNAQGSCASPILANIYLDKLDRFMENIIQRDTKGKYRKQNPKYAKLRYQLNKAISVHDIKEIKRLRKELKATSSVDVFDPNFRRVHYVRYADDLHFEYLPFSKKIRGTCYRFLYLASLSHFLFYRCVFALTHHHRSVIFYFTDESEPSLVIIGCLEIEHLIINMHQICIYIIHIQIKKSTIFNVKISQSRNDKEKNYSLSMTIILLISILFLYISLLMFHHYQHDNHRPLNKEDVFFDRAHKVFEPHPSIKDVMKCLYLLISRGWVYQHR